MNKKIIKKLALESYTKDNLDSKKVDRIVKYLGRSDLKLYIKAIKNYEQSRTVTLLLPSISDRISLVKEVEKLFPNKKIIIKVDENLIAGIRIIDSDSVYDFNMQNTLENLVSHVNQ
jgi:F0F1-type ATP synthase delta subunit